MFSPVVPLSLVSKDSLAVIIHSFCYCFALSFLLILAFLFYPRFSPILGLGAQVPSRWSGLSFTSECHSRPNSSITRPKPGNVVPLAVKGPAGPRLLHSGSPLGGQLTRYTTSNFSSGPWGEPLWCLILG